MPGVASIPISFPPSDNVGQFFFGARTFQIHFGAKRVGGFAPISGMSQGGKLEVSVIKSGRNIQFSLLILFIKHRGSSQLFLLTCRRKLDMDDCALVGLRGSPGPPPSAGRGPWAFRSWDLSLSTTVMTSFCPSAYLNPPKCVSTCFSLLSGFAVRYRYHS